MASEGDVRASRPCLPETQPEATRMFPLRTELPTVRLRPWQPADREALVRHANNRRVWRNLRDTFPHPYTDADARAWIDLASTPGASLFLAIESDEEAVGGIGIVAGEGDRLRTGEFGYWLGERHWGKGVATAAVRALRRHAFADALWQRLEAPVFAWNPASMRVLEKAGFVREGALPESVLKDGQWIDCILYVATRGD